MATTNKISTKTLFVTLLFTFCVTSNLAAISTDLVRVYTTNGLEGGKNLKMHCKSKNDDLGEKLLTPGATWMFHFHPNWFGGTLFFCSFTWDGLDDYRYYNIYVQSRDYNICHDCCWTIRSDGPCTCPCGRACDFHDCRPWKPRRSLVN